jgi:hypothetical protein
MNRKLGTGLGSVAAVVVLAGSTVGIASAAFAGRIAREVDDLLAAAAPATPTVVGEADLAPLPEPVQRWLRYAGVVGRERPARVHLRQDGELRLGDRGWFPFTAEEYYTTDPPGFVWVPTMTLARVIPVIGRDKYIDGKGSIEMRLGGLVSVARDSGPDMDRGALLRYLNEIMWFPAAAISPHIRWEAIDANSARATMTYGGVSAPAVFSFDAAGRLTTMEADRFDRESGTVEPWLTPVTAYGELAGLRIPVAGEGVYRREAGDYPYIRIRITALEYNWADRD